MIIDGACEGGTISWGKGRKIGGSGVVVLFWWGSVHERLIEARRELYASLGWTSLLCHANFLSACFPERSSALADILLSELLRELKLRPRPFVFEALSGGPNLCTYKSYQIVRGKSETSFTQDEILLLRRCFSGHIYTSGHFDFSPDLASRLSLHPIIRKIPTSTNFISFLSKTLRTISFESPIPLHWETLYHSIDLEAPYLIFASSSTLPLVKKLKSLGGDVTHKEHRPTSTYGADVALLLAKAVALYPQRVQYMGEMMRDEISEMICDLQEAAVNSNRSLRSVGYGSGDNFYVSGSTSEMKEVCPLRMSGHSVLGQVLYGGCVPKNVEGWDVRFGSLRRRYRNGVPRARL